MDGSLIRRRVKKLPITNTATTMYTTKKPPYLLPLYLNISSTLPINNDITAAVARIQVSLNPKYLPLIRSGTRLIIQLEPPGLKKPDNKYAKKYILPNSNSLT